jgi:hypothetical protein
MIETVEGYCCVWKETERERGVSQSTLAAMVMLNSLSTAFTRFPTAATTIHNHSYKTHTNKKYCDWYVDNPGLSSCVCGCVCVYVEWGDDEV